jgi:hypothetical protein
MMTRIKDYYPTYWSGCNPIHPVHSWALVRRLIRALRRGESIPPVLLDGWRNGNMLTGTHRCAANDIILMLRSRSNRWDNVPLIGYIELSDLPDVQREAVLVCIADDNWRDVQDIAG